MIRMIHITQAVLDQIKQIFDKRKNTVGLSKYSVSEMLDQGGMSNVYRIVDKAGHTDFVLRVSEEHKSSYSNNIFNVREMEILKELKKNSQPHVVQYLDAFIVDIPGQPRYYCAVMKFLCTLKNYPVKGDGVEIAVRLGCDFLPLLQSFMDKRILHRDIKPENIFYDKDFRNETGFLLGDFGIAKRNSVTSVTPVGTESTMAPEVRGLDRTLGNDRAFGDMYSLGMVMYMYLNQGVYPSNGERIEKIPPDKAPFPEPRYGSKRLKMLVVKSTSYNPNDRFESPQAMLRELQNCDEYKQFIEQGCNQHQETMQLPSDNETVQLTDCYVCSQSDAADSESETMDYSASNGNRFSLKNSQMTKKKTVLISAIAVILIGVCLTFGLWFALGNKAERNAASENEKIVIIEQPTDVLTKPNKQVTFRVVASGTGLEYQWYYKKKNNKSWSLWRVHYTAEIQPSSNSTWDGLQVRCKITDNEGNSVYSDTASVTLVPFEPDDFQITKQPESYTLKNSDVGKKTLQFSVKANGKKMKYQWYFCKAGETTWTLWDERTSSSFKAVPNESWNGILIYCKITNDNAEELYSNICSVTFS